MNEIKNAPDVIKLLEKKYTITELYPNDEKPLQIGELVEHYDIIAISPNQSEENKKITMFHELVHALFIQTGHSQYGENEELIDCIALGIYSLIKNNNFDFMKGE